MMDQHRLVQKLVNHLFELHYGFYGAPRDYDDIDPDPNACVAHFTELMKGFPNFAIQLAYQGDTA